jgi:membrane protease YdiL (CAAX protease family)
LEKDSSEESKMKKTKDWIKHHQAIAFYVLALSISWGLEFAYDACINRDQYLLLPIAFVGICGPGLAGIIISAFTNTQPKGGSRKEFWIAFVVAWFVSSLVSLANLNFIEHTQLSAVVIGLFTISVVPVAFVIASAYSRNPAVRNYLSSLVRLRGVWGWSFVALLLIPVLFLISVPLDTFLGKQSNLSIQFPKISFSLLGLIAVKFFYQFFFFNATGEETGWRGFVLPRLQARTSPLLASLIIGFIWASWHFPYWRSDGRPVLTLEFWIEMWIGHILASFLIVWMYNRSKGSILVAGIAHAAMNTYQAFAPFSNSLFLILSAAVLVVILSDRMWKRLTSDHPAVHQEPGMFELEKVVPEKKLEVSHV